jgi:parallel beta-helix repeat protein
MKRLKSVLILCLLVFVETWATDYYVSVEGSDSNYGTSTGSAFATLTKAISKAVAGDVIYMLEGTYSYTSKISLSRSGTAAKPITLQAYGSDHPVINFSGMSFSSSNRGLSLSGDYWIIKGLKEQDAGDNGMFISGSHNTIENCIFFKNRDTGLQLANGAANNRIINCDSYGNADPTDYGDADGFACKMDVGTR